MLLLVASLEWVGSEGVCHARMFSAMKVRRTGVLGAIRDAWVREQRILLGRFFNFEDVGWHAWRTLAEPR